VSQAWQAFGMRPTISWHRGGSELAASATLAAFASAAERAAEWIEVDVRRTADGRLVCVHDSRLPAIGAIADLNYDSLGVAQRGTVPTLQELLAVLDEAEARSGAGDRSGLHLDLKGTGHESEAIEVIRESGRRFLVTTLHDESVMAARAVAPDVPVLLSLGRTGAGLELGARVRMHLSELWPYGRLRRCGATGVALVPEAGYDGARLDRRRLSSVTAVAHPPGCRHRHYEPSRRRIATAGSLMIRSNAASRDDARRGL
jgi:glycerophosphoryl diester phosphodiesterase